MNRRNIKNNVTYGYLFKVLLVCLLMDPRVDDYEVIWSQSFGLLLGQVAEVFIVRDVAHAACSIMPLSLLTPLPISYGLRGILLLKHGLFVRLAYVGIPSARIRCFPYRKRFHLLPRTQALQVKRVGVKNATPNHCSVTQPRGLAAS